MHIVVGATMLVIARQISTRAMPVYYHTCFLSAGGGRPSLLHITRPTLRYHVLRCQLGALATYCHCLCCGGPRPGPAPGAGRCAQASTRSLQEKERTTEIEKRETSQTVFDAQWPRAQIYKENYRHACLVLSSLDNKLNFWHVQGHPSKRKPRTKQFLSQTSASLLRRITQPR